MFPYVPIISQLYGIASIRYIMVISLRYLANDDCVYIIYYIYKYIKCNIYIYYIVLYYIYIVYIYNIINLYNIKL